MRSRLVFPNKKALFQFPLLKVRTTKSLKKEEKDSQCGPLCPHLSESNQDLFQRLCKKSTQALYSSTFTYRKLHISKEVLTDLSSLNQPKREKGSLQKLILLSGYYSMVQKKPRTP